MVTCRFILLQLLSTKQSTAVREPPLLTANRNRGAIVNGSTIHIVFGTKSIADAGPPSGPDTCDMGRNDGGDIKGREEIGVKYTQSYLQA